MTLALTVSFSRTEDLDADTRAAIIEVCIAAHQEQEFSQLFSYIPSGGRHFLGYRAEELVSHAVVTTRWLQPEGLCELKTAYVDAVATTPAYQGQGYGSAVVRHLATHIPDYEIACLETDRIGFYQRLGWQIWKGALGGRSEQGVIATPDQEGIMILRLERTPVLNLNGGLTIECQTGRIW